MDRIQRKRTKDFSLPPNTLVITRGTKWGNKHKVEQRDGVWCVLRNDVWYEQATKRSALTVSVRLYENDITPEMEFEFINHCKENNIEHLACFCPADSPCHGDVWLDVWNEYKSGQSTESEN